MDIQKLTTHYMYSTYFINEIENLEIFAQYIIKSNFCKTIYHSCNILFMENEGEIIEHDIELKKDPHNPSGKITLPKELKGYNDIYLYQAANHRIYKDYFFSNSSTTNISYIKCFMDKFIATDEKYVHHFYPILTIYSTGIIILDLQTFSANSQNEISEEDFFNKNVNLYKEKFLNMKVPASLSTLAILENITSFSFTVDDIKNLIEYYNEDDDEFINIDLKNFYNDFDEYDLGFLKDYIFSYIELLYSDWLPRNKNILGSYWMGKPIIMIDRHNFNAEEKDNLIYSTLARTPYDNKNSDLIQKKNMRHMDDYELYMSECISLFINKNIDDNDINAIQSSIIVIEEEVIHLYLLLKQEYERIDETTKLKDIFISKRFINYLKKLLLYKNSSSGEINSIIKTLLYEHYKIQIEEELIEKLIEEKQSEILYNAEKNRNSFYNIMSVFFSIISSSTIFEFIVTPLFITINTPNITKVLYFIGSLIILLIIIFLLKMFFSLKNLYKR